LSNPVQLILLFISQIQLLYLQETLDIDLEDLEVIATLGVGGFGRVELVQVHIFRTAGRELEF